MNRTKHLAIILIIFILLIIAILPNSLAVDSNNDQENISSGQFEKGYRYNIQGWVYLHIEGEPYERGYQYGYLASAEIVDMINRWGNWGHKEKFMKVFIKKNRPENYDELSKTYWELCKQRGMKFFWDQYPKEYQEEIKGIANGVREKGGAVHGKLVDYKDIFTLNIIEETRETFNNPGGRGQPFRMMFNMLKGAVKSLLKVTGFEGIGRENYETGNCMAFLATGDATSDGGIVFSHSTIFPPNYIPQRANIILDVQPSKGHRFIITVFPGYIWSSEDYYQNDCGILLAETSIWPPVGPWKVRGTTSVGVRARRAIQYSESINDVIDSMLDGNNGLYPADWVMGDTKTGEIASLELGLHSHAITRKKDGFLWSCCNAKDEKVRWDLWSIYGFGIPGRFLRFLPPIKYTPSPADKKFEELGNKYYGGIDVDVVKEIMAAPPISNLPIDCKITDSKLVEDMGLWAFMGRPDGDHFTPKPEDQKELKGLTEVPGAGWVRAYGGNSNQNSIETKNVMIDKKNNDDILWVFETEDERNIDYASCIVSDGILNVATSTGKIYTLDSNSGRLSWDENVSEKPVTSAASDDLLFIGSSEGLYAFDKKSGDKKWERLIEGVTSKPVVFDDIVIASFSNDEVYIFDKDSGETVWSDILADDAVISDVDRGMVYIGSSDTCYAFDLIGKKVKWQYKTNGVITAYPGLKDDVVYVGSWDGNIYALDASTGNLKWKYQTGWGIDSTPDVSDGTVFVGSLDNNFYALDEDDGELKWFFTCKSAIHSNPVAYGEYVFFGCDDGRFYALNKKDGKLEWSFTPGYFIKDNDVNNYITTPILSNPVVEDGVVYFGAKGNVYALDAQTVDTAQETIEEPLIPYGTIFIAMMFLGIALISMSLFIHFHYKKKCR